MAEQVEEGAVRGGSSAGSTCSKSSGCSPSSCVKFMAFAHILDDREYECADVQKYERNHWKE